MADSRIMRDKATAALMAEVGFFKASVIAEEKARG